MARCLDDAHAAAPDLPLALRAAETASVRTAAMQTAAQVMPVILAVFGQQNPDLAAPTSNISPSKHRENLLKQAPETSLEDKARNRGLDRIRASTPTTIAGSIHASDRKLAAAGGSPQQARSI
jgi:hypothetical protein